MKEYLKEKPIETFTIPDGVVFAKINGASGAVAKSDEPGAVYAAFADGVPAPGSGPKLEGEEGTAAIPGHEEGDDQLRLRQVRPSSSEGYFKSELF
jgi:penicillin-binding protein 1A